MSYAGGSRPQVLLDGLTDEQLRQQYARRDASNDFEAMPTVNGAPIVESGSNTDGEWVRWSDGTQQCRHALVLHEDTQSNSSVQRRGVAIVWTYPAPFVAGSTPIFTPTGAPGYFQYDGYIAGQVYDTGSISPTYGFGGADKHLWAHFSYHYITYNGWLGAYLKSDGRWK